MLYAHPGTLQFHQMRQKFGVFLHVKNEGWHGGTTLIDRRQAMAKSSSIYVGMDVHKDTIDIALTDGDARGEVRHYASAASSGRLPMPRRVCAGST